MPTIGETLKKPAGPLPVWAWALGGVGVLAAFLIYRQKKNASAPTDAALAASQQSTNLATGQLSNLTPLAGPMPFQMGDTFVNTTQQVTPQTTINPPPPAPVDHDHDHKPPPHNPPPVTTTLYNTTGKYGSPSLPAASSAVPYSGVGPQLFTEGFITPKVTGSAPTMQNWQGWVYTGKGGLPKGSPATVADMIKRGLLTTVQSNNPQMITQSVPAG